MRSKDYTNYNFKNDINKISDEFYKCGNEFAKNPKNNVRLQERELLINDASLIIEVEEDCIHICSTQALSNKTSRFHLKDNSCAYVSRIGEKPKYKELENDLDYSEIVNKLVIIWLDNLK